MKTSKVLVHNYPILGLIADTLYEVRVQKEGQYHITELFRYWILNSH